MKTNNSFCKFEPIFFHYNRNLSSNMPRPHFHENYEIYYLISGRRRYFIENEIYDVYPGDMILIPEMQVHKVWNTPDVGPNEYHERFLLTPRKEDIPEKYLPCFNTHLYRLPEDAKKTILDCFHTLQANSNKIDEYTEDYNLANLVKILCTLARLPESSKHTSLLSKNDILMQEAAQYIRTNCSEQLTLNELAKKYSFSKEYFSTIFKETTGFGFNEYLNQMRVSKAIELLNSTSLSITEISVECGFNDSNYFATVFNKIVGTSPNLFRPKRVKGN